VGVNPQSLDHRACLLLNGPPWCITDLDATHHICLLPIAKVMVNEQSKVFGLIVKNAVIRCLIVWGLVCWTVSERLRVQIQVRTEIWLEISDPVANSAIMSTLIVHCRWKDERERTGHLASYAEAKKRKSLTLHTQGSLTYCSSLFSHPPSSSSSLVCK